MDSLVSTLHESEQAVQKLKSEYQKLNQQLENAKNRDQSEKMRCEQQISELRNHIRDLENSHAKAENEHNKVKIEFGQLIKSKELSRDTIAEQIPRLKSEKIALEKIHEQQRQDCFAFFEEAIKPLQMVSETFLE